MIDAFTVYRSISTKKATKMWQKCHAHWFKLSESCLNKISVFFFDSKLPSSPLRLSQPYEIARIWVRRHVKKKWKIVSSTLEAKFTDQFSFWLCDKNPLLSHCVWETLQANWSKTTVSIAFFFSFTLSGAQLDAMGSFAMIKPHVLNDRSHNWLRKARKRERRPRNGVGYSGGYSVRWAQSNTAPFQVFFFFTSKRTLTETPAICRSLCTA